MLGAALAVVAAVQACSDAAPDAGTLEPIFARLAEDIRVLSLGRGQTLGRLLEPSVGGDEQYRLMLAFREQASPRRMRPGTEVTLRFRPSDHWLRRVDVQISRDRTIRLRHEEGLGWSSETVETPVFVDTLYAGGTIESVLWTSVVRNPALSDLPIGDRARLIDALDRVFQWQVDFSRQIRVGDTYRFVFERERRPDGSLRSGRLLAAELVNSGTPYYAIWFDPNGDARGSYYDLEGRSVRRAFLRKPLSYRRISSRFSTGRYHPILKRWRAHKGVDYAARAGTPVMATADGVVVYRGRKGGYGNLVEIRHPNGFRTRYGHLKGFARAVKLGTRVHQGDVIGYVGATGLATGPHLHYEMIRGGRQIDPLVVALPAGDPVPADDRGRWLNDMITRVALLETVPGPMPVRVVSAHAQDSDAVEHPGGTP